MKIIDYRILLNTYPYDMEMEVMQAIKIGWQPLGILQILPATEDSKHALIQTIVKYEELGDGNNPIGAFEEPCNHIYKLYRQFANGTPSVICSKCGYRSDLDETLKSPIDETVNKG